MNIVVLGMHRSGTSVLTKLLVKMGCYFGPDSQHTYLGEENPTGFWERRDMRLVCDYLLHSRGADWWKVSSFENGAHDHKVERETARRLKQALADLNGYSPWVLKEPRLCLLLPELQRYLPDILCVVAYRSPRSVTKSLNTRNGFDTEFGLALWEYYTARSIHAARCFPNVVVNYDDLVDSPEATTRKLYTALQEKGMSQLSLPSKETIARVVLKKLRRSELTASDELLSATQQALFAYLGKAEYIAEDTDFSIGQDLVDILAQHESRLVQKDTRTYRPSVLLLREPTVDINMVSYGDADVLEHVLESIGNQTYKKFRLNILEDYSPDQSLSVAKRYAASDKRITVFESKVNLGLVRNFIRGFHTGDAELVMLKSSNDPLAPTYVEQLVEMLRVDPNLGLAYARARLVHADGRSEEYPDDHYFRTDERDPLGSAVTVMTRYFNASPLWGIFRRKIVERCRMYPYVVGGDHILVCEASLYGGIDYVDTALLERRAHARGAEQLALLHSEDAARGMPLDSIFADDSHVVGYILLLHGHWEMFAKAAVPEEIKHHLTRMAHKILLKRFSPQMNAQAERFVSVVANKLNTIQDLSAVEAGKYIVEATTILNKCRFVLPKHEGLKELGGLLQRLMPAYRVNRTY